MSRISFTPATVPECSSPGPLLQFIQRAELEIYYRDNHPVRPPAEDETPVAIPGRRRANTATQAEEET